MLYVKTMVDQCGDPKMDLINFAHIVQFDQG